MSTAYFSIKGLRCASCVANIERALRVVSGIQDISISLVSSKAKIVYDENNITIEGISSAISQLGYTPTYIVLNETSHIKKETRLQEEYIAKLFRQLCIALATTIPLVILAMSTMHSELSFMVTLAFALFQLVLVLPVLAISYERLVAGIKALYAYKPTMDSLIVLGVGTAFLYSLIQTGYIFLGGTQYYSQLYFESAGTILTLVLLGEYLEKRAKFQASKTLLSLVSLSPHTATKIEEGGKTTIVPIALLEKGDIVLVQQGMSVPTDGIITNGEGMLNESMLTGESMPVLKSKGEKVFAGTIVVEGTVHIVCNALPSESQLNKLIIAVEQAQQSKAPIARLADIASQYFVPAVLFIALCAGVAWYIATTSLSVSLGIIIATLIIACPCAMGLATPLSLIIAMGRATKYGIVVKNSLALQQSSSIDTIFFDKTGTITSGNPQITSSYLLGDETNEKIKEYIAPITHYSSHPITKALEQYVSDINTAYSIEHFEYTLGKGITAHIKDIGNSNILYAHVAVLRIGSLQFMKDIALYPTEQHDVIEQYCQEMYMRGESPLYIAKDKNIIALLGVKDTVRHDAKEAIEKLQKQNIRCIMLSGDIPQTAKAIANEVGIQDVYAGLLPEEKASIIEEYKSKGAHIMMVGDGINDAVALSCADVGVAMGKGVDIAQEASDIVLLTESLSGIYNTIMLSKLTITNIKQNLFWAFFYNTISIPIAAGALYSISGLLLSPMIASGAMVFSSLSVVGNALRLQYKKLL